MYCSSQIVQIFRNSCYAKTCDFSMKVGIQKDVGLISESASKYTMSKFQVKYPADVTMNYAFGMDVCNALSNFKYPT